ncbi:MAG: patatin-like phospholipase family protein [Rudaea sp.]|nr:patatin-like phospholipase family protein [Rudaea sp.]
MTSAIEGAAAGSNSYTDDFETVRVAESDWLARRRRAANLPPPDDDLVGVAFSGGGIRSAVFNLGVLQALEAGGVIHHVDYLSSVSGGGYIASCYTWLKTQLKTQPPGAGVFAAELAGSAGRVLDWLRGHGKYLVSHRGFSLWTLVASILAAMFINVLVLGPLLLAAVYALTLDWLPVTWPQWLVLPGTCVPQGHHGYWLLLALGGLCLAVLPFAAIVFAFVAGIPHLADVRRVDAWRVAMGRLIAFGPALIALGLIPIAASLGEMAEHMLTTRHAHAIGKHASYLVPLLSGIASMLLDKYTKAQGRGRLATVGLSLLVYGLLILCYHVVADADLPRSVPFLGFVALSVLLAFVCDINRVSIHAYYRARLSDAFLPNVQHTMAVDPGEFALNELDPDDGGPLQLINTTLNTTSSRNESLHSREGASFFFSPEYAGSSATGFRRIDSYASGAVALSNALTISGAAIDPDMFVTSGRPMSFLMALFNIRLGCWAHNPRCADERDPLRPWWWVFITREMLGIGLDETRRHVHLSDGGGFENLGIYELVRRRVRYLIVTDAGADPQTTLSDLGRAIERVRVDFGAQIDLAADRLFHQRDQVLAQRPYVLGGIRYADGSEGRVLYIRPVLCAGLTADIYAYWRAHPAFPDEPTSEQFFAEPQFEAYRALGQQIVAGLLVTAPPTTVGEWFERLQETGAGA